MKPIKVYLQYPLFKSDSQYYKSIIDSPPKEVFYRTSHENPGMISNTKKLIKFRTIKKFIRSFYNKTGFPFP